MPPPEPASPSERHVLLAYYSYTQQTRAVVDAMAEVFSGRGYAVSRSAIEFTDQRYVDRFSRFPMRHAFLEVLAMLPAQLRRATGEIRIPDEARQGSYDLVCVGSPTWWLTTSMPIRSFLKARSTRELFAGTHLAAFVVCRRYWRNNLGTVKKLGTAHGAEFLGGAHFRFAGGQIRSLLSLISYLGTGEQRESYLGVRIPATNLGPDDLARARAFAGHLADRLAAASPPSPTTGSTPPGEPVATGPDRGRIVGSA